MTNINVYFDGGSKPQRVGFLWEWHGYGSYEIEADGLHFKMERERFGKMTCNQAEYTAFIKALEWMFPKIPFGLKPVINIFTDSKLVREQVMDNWKAKKPHLKDLCSKAQALLSQSYRWNIQWRSRVENVKRFGH